MAEISADISLVRADLERLPAYVPGRRPEKSNNTSIARLASNESPFAPLPSVQRALEAELSGANRYPDMGCAGVIADLAAHLEVDPARIAVGNGSSSLIRDLVTAVAGPDDEVLFATPSFPYYGNAAIIAGADPVRVVLNEAYGHDLDAMAQAITAQTRVVFVCNPNNPTGARLSRAAIAAFIAQVPERVLIVVDEAYIEFCPEGTDSLPLVAAYSNVAVLRTFSKAFGLAGLRVGYLVGPTDVVSFVRRVTVPFTVNTFAQVAARASLETGAQAELQARVRDLVEQRDELTARIHVLTIPIVESHANFVFLPLGERSAAFAATCEAHGVYVRAVGGGVRVSIGNAVENAQFLAAAEEWASAR